MPVRGKIQLDDLTPVLPEELDSTVEKLATIDAAKIALSQIPRFSELRKRSEFWTEEKVEIVKAMWSDGATSSTIGRVLGCSRNAIIGKVTRLRKQTADGPASRAVDRIYKATTVSKKLKIGRRQIGGNNNTMGIMAALRRREIMELPPEIVDNPIAFVDLEPQHCRWPVEGEGHATLFCGAEIVEKLSYCACHALRAYAERRRMTAAEYAAHLRARKAKAAAA